MTKPPLNPETDAQSRGDEAEETAASSSNDYAVGYRTPPKHTRFQKGRSGNPRGRPKGAKGTKVLLAGILDEGVRIKTHSGTRTISKREAMLRKLLDKALKGDQKATQVLIKIDEEAAAAETDMAQDSVSGTTLSADDQAILDAYKDRILSKSDARGPSNRESE